MNNYERQFTDFFIRFNGPSRLRTNTDQFLSCPSTPTPASSHTDTATTHTANLLSEAAAVLNCEAVVSLNNNDADNNVADTPLTTETDSRSVAATPNTINNALDNYTESVDESTATSHGNVEQNVSNSLQITAVGNAGVNNGTSRSRSRHITRINAPKAAKFHIVPPNAKTIFVSRFAADTTCKQIIDFVCENLPEKTQVSVIKIKTKPGREKLSFKITVPEKFFDTVVDSSFWPEHTLVREYTNSLPETSRTLVDNNISSHYRAPTSQIRGQSYKRKSRFHEYQTRRQSNIPTSRRRDNYGRSNGRINSLVVPVGQPQSSTFTHQSTGILCQPPQSTTQIIRQQSTLNSASQSTNLNNNSNHYIYNQQSTQIPYSHQQSSALPNLLQNYTSDRPVIQYIPANQSRSNNGSVVLTQNYTAHQPLSMPN